LLDTFAREIDVASRVSRFAARQRVQDARGRVDRPDHDANLGALVTVRSPAISER
jgi:hypothetical protein